MGVMENPQVKAAIWARVSTGHQDEQNQVPAMEKFAEHRGWQITRRYELAGVSAWNGAHRTMLRQVLDNAHKGEFSVLIVWAVDRLTREGALALLQIIRKLHDAGCMLVSVQESWLNTNSEIQEALVAFAATMARLESERKSARIKEGLDKRKAKGLPVGRAKGARDKKPRNRSGYVARWEREHGKAAS
jgi:DNA invertase Pin-like site-specific DNA recombinase